MTVHIPDNNRFKTVCRISEKLNGEVEIIEGINEQFSAEDFVFLNLMPITPVDEDRNISRYKLYYIFFIFIHINNFL